MHILHLIKTSEGATWAIRMLQEIQLKYPHISFSVVIPPGGKHFNEYKELCTNVYEFDFNLNRSIIKNGNLLKTIVATDNPDIIHSWFTQTTLYARIFLRHLKIPRIFQVVGPAHLENPIFRLGDIKSSQKKDYWIATSKYILNIYKNAGVSDDRLFLNYAFIDTAKLLDAKEEVKPRNFRKEFHIDNDVKIIGTASFIYPPKFYEKTGVKGHEQLLNAFRALLRKRNDVVLVIAGTTFGKDYSYENKLKQMAKEISTDKIFFTGKFEHVYEVISNFDVFVYLSKSENLGGVYESLFFEIPTVSSNRGALPELVINDETGFNVDPNDIDILTEKINLLLNHEFYMNVIRGKQLVLDTFNKETIVDTAYSIYEKVLKDQMSSGNIEK